MFEEITKDKALELYKKMKLCRRFEEKVVELVNKDEIYGVTHEYVGQEAVAVGVCSALEKNDCITSTHRGHGHIIAKGGEIKFMFSELFGKANGYNSGKGGSMHIANPALGILGANGIVGAGTPIAAGAALAFKIKNLKHVAVSFFGDGAMNQGVVHEAMNMAAIWDLPIIFVCENNQYAVTTSVKYSTRIKNLSDRAKAYGFSGQTINGMDVLEVYNTTKKLVDEIREKPKPFLLECITYRYHGHFTGEHLFNWSYRAKEEIDYYLSICPIKTFAEKLIDNKIASEEELTKIDSLVEGLINDGVDFAKTSKLPDPEDSLKDMYSKNYDGMPQRGWV
jgi:acetoin:2,6-dichlorophenolindophenol oxidoreductase subunit alpha